MTANQSIKRSFNRGETCLRNRLSLMQSRRQCSVTGRAKSYAPLDHYTEPACDPFVAHPLMRRAGELCGRGRQCEMGDVK